MKGTTPIVQVFLDKLTEFGLSLNPTQWRQIDASPSFTDSLRCLLQAHVLKFPLDLNLGEMTQIKRVFTKF